jgi:transketolase
MLERLGKIVSERLTLAAAKDSSIWVLDGDLADSYGADAFAAAHPDRFISAGIAEQSMVSVAAGLAACGIRPWVFSFAAFLTYRAYDQIRVGISQTGLPVALVASHAGGCGGRNGKTHVALNDVALMASLPRIAIWTPADAGDENWRSITLRGMVYLHTLGYPATHRCPFQAGLRSAGSEPVDELHL